MDPHLYVLNHNFQKTHFETFFLTGGVVVRGVGVEITSLEASTFFNFVVQQEWPYLMFPSRPQGYPFLPSHKQRNHIRWQVLVTCSATRGWR